MGAKDEGLDLMAELDAIVELGRRGPGSDAERRTAQHLQRRLEALGRTATIEQLDELPGVGPVTAHRIVDYRTAHGPFATVDDLDAVPGIGPTRIEQLRDLVTP